MRGQYCSGRHGQNAPRRIPAAFAPRTRLPRGHAFARLRAPNARLFARQSAAHTAADIGDEPFQISRNCPFAQVAVAEKRVIGIRQLMALPNPPQVIVLDDAFQHRYVRAGLNILLTDAHRLYTTDHLLPWGRLREPASSARRAQVVVVTKCVGSERPALPVEEGQHLFYSHIQYAAPQPFDAHSTVLTGNNGPDAAPEPWLYAGRTCSHCRHCQSASAGKLHQRQRCAKRHDAFICRPPCVHGERCPAHQPGMAKTARRHVTRCPPGTGRYHAKGRHAPANPDSAPPPRYAARSACSP